MRHVFPSSHSSHPTRTLLALVVFISVVAFPEMNAIAEWSTPAQGGVLRFADALRTRPDDTKGLRDSIVLANYDGLPLKALQFRFRNTNSRVRIASVELAPTLRNDPRWLFMSDIRRSVVQPDLGSNDTVSVVLLGQQDAELPPNALQGLVHFIYETVNIDSTSADSTVLELFDVVGSLAGGIDAMLTVEPSHTIRLVNRINKADVNYDDDVNINDLLDLMYVILGRVTYSGDRFVRADVSPWPTGDDMIDVKDLALTQQVILNGAYPDGMPLHAASAPSGNAAHSAPAASPDAKVTVYVNKRGVTVRLENTVNVKGIQLELSNIPSVPDTAKVSTIWGPGSYGFSNNTLRILALDLSGGTLVTPGNRLVIDMVFDIANPLQVGFKKLIVAKEDNTSLADVEVSLVYGTPNSNRELPVLPAYELGQNYPNPFNPSTRIPFQLPARGEVRLVISNALGEVVRTLYTGVAESGRHNLFWDGTADDGSVVPGGMYFYTLFTPSTRFTRKMLYLH